MGGSLDGGSGKHEGPGHREQGHPEASIKAGNKLQEEALSTYSAVDNTRALHIQPRGLDMPSRNAEIINKKRNGQA